MPFVKLVISFLIATLSLNHQPAQAQTESKMRCGFALNDVGTSVIREGGYLEKFERASVSGKKTMKVLFTSSRTTNPNTVWNNKRIIQDPRLRNLAAVIFEGCDDVDTVTFRTLEDGRTKNFYR